MSPTLLVAPPEASVECAADALPLPANPRFSQRPDPLYHGILLGLCATVLLLAGVLSVRGTTQVVLPFLNMPLPELCMMRRTWGLDCPGCGLTRCFISLAHGDLAAAWSFNPAGLLLFALIAFQIPYRAVQLNHIRRGQPEIQLSGIAQLSLLLVALALFAQWGLRLLTSLS